MIATQIISTIVLIICIIVFITTAGDDDKPITLISFILGMFSFVASCGSSFKNYEELYNHRCNMKVDLPEEIYLSRPGDTLYINKRTKDSIYLGFKPIK